jgi:hypothetical protein
MVQILILINMKELIDYFLGSDSKKPRAKKRRRGKWQQNESVTLT